MNECVGISACRASSDAMPATGNKKILAYAYHGKLAKLRKLLEEEDVKLLNCPSVNFSDDIGTTALHAACQQGHPECVALLLEAGASPLARTKDGRTVLSAALPSRKHYIQDAIDRIGPKARAQQQQQVTGSAATAPATTTSWRRRPANTLRVRELRKGLKMLKQLPSEAERFAVPSLLSRGADAAMEPILRS